MGIYVAASSRGLNNTNPLKQYSYYHLIHCTVWVVVFILLTYVNSEDDTKSLQPGRVLLPDVVRPFHYDIHLDTFFHNFTFSGRERINIQISHPTTSIFVNGLDLVVTGCTLSMEGDVDGTGDIDGTVHAASTGGCKIYRAVDIMVNNEEETIEFVFERELVVGRGVLEVNFSGEIGNKLVGFYRSQYQWNGETRYMGATQFQPVDARRVFPCWDEPSIKATFSLSISAPRDLTILGNMPPKLQMFDEDVQTKTVWFERTPLMSTYLIAFCIGHFEFLEAKTNEDITVRVWTTPGKIGMGSFALDIAIKTLSYFTSYYDIPYPLPKLDMIALPDFGAGAMENWGLITYREIYLLCDNETASVKAKSLIANVIAHELAHQWFGNLVTMEWWEELWLNEGFATFAAVQATDNFFPEWDLWTQFVSDYTFAALNFDSLRSSHPVEVAVSRARSIDEIFDTISYCKGAGVIRMIESFLGHDLFRTGLTAYLNHFKYGNAATEDLWRFLSRDGHNVTMLMDNWTKKIGYPVITVQETDHKEQFQISQQRYLRSNDLKPEEDQTVWVILMSVTSSTNSTIRFYKINEKETILSLADGDTDTSVDSDWMKFNAGQSGLYRVKYSRNMSSKLAQSIHYLEPVDRLGIENDALSLAKSGTISMVQALEILENYVHESSCPVWSDISNNLEDFISLLEGTEALPYFDNFILSLYREISKIGWESSGDETDLMKLLRSIVLDKLGSHGDKLVIAEAQKRFKEFLVDRNSLPTDISGVVFKLAIRNGGEFEYDQMTAFYTNTTSPELKIKALQSIGYTLHPHLILRALEYSFTEHVRSQDLPHLIKSCASTSQGRELTWKFLRDNWDKFLEILGPSSFIWSHIIPKTAQNFETREKALEIEQFFSTHPLPSRERTIQQTIESVLINTAFLSKNLEETTIWLKQHYSPL